MAKCGVSISTHSLDSLVDCGKIRLAEIPAVISPYIIQVAGALLSASIPSRVCVCVCVPPKRNQSMRGGRFVSWWERPKRIRNKNKKKGNNNNKMGKAKKETCVCVRELYIRETMLSMKALEPVRLENYGRRERKRFSQLVLFFSFLFLFFFPCPSPWLSFFVAADGWWAVRQRMVISRFHLSVCVWCSTKRTQTKSLRRHTVFTL